MLLLLMLYQLAYYFRTGLSSLDYFAVFDGHDGSEASTKCAEELHGYLEPGKARAEMPAIFEKAYALMHKGMPQRGGACALTVLIRDNEIWVANVGDSRCVLLTASDVERLSVDHKPNDETEKRRIEEKGGKVEWDGKGKCWRIQPGNCAVARALGDRSVPGVSQQPSVRMRALDASAKLLVLGSDGLWDEIDDKELTRHVLRYGTDGAHVLAQRLLKTCMEKRTSGDNTSIIVVYLQDKIF